MCTHRIVHYTFGCFVRSRYYSQRFTHDAGISQFKQVTDTLRKHLPSVRVGMNQSPVTPPSIATYTGNPVHSMIRCFREGCMDLPW